MPSFDRVTRLATNFSAMAIAGLLIGLHPDMTAALQVLCTVAIAVGWLTATSPRSLMLGVWVAAAILAPAPLRLLSGREGPVLDIFWMAGLTASLLRTAPWTSWALAPGTRLIAGAWALTLALAFPVLVARELAFDPRLIFDTGAINAWTGWSAPQVVTWIAFVTWTHLLGLIWLDWMAARCTAVPDRAPRVLHALWIPATIASLVAIYQGLVDVSVLNTPFWIGHERASGTLLDANAYGVCAALAAPSVILALHGASWRRADVASLVIAAINLAGLWMSGSRAALLCGGIAVAAIVAALWMTGTRRRLLGVSAAAAAVVVVIVIATGAMGPLGRLFERPTGTTGSLAAAALMRGPYGEAANEMVRDYPLTGVGIGTYQHLAADYQRRRANEALPFDNAQNWWRHQAAELGLFGALPLFLWSALIAWQVVTARARPGRLFEATLVRSALLALGVCSIVQIPTQSPVILLWFFVFVAWLPGLVSGAMVIAARGATAAAALLAIAYASGHLVLGRGPLAVAERAKTFGREYAIGAYRAEPMEDTGQFRWTDDESRFIWPLRTRWFVIQLWAHHPDIESNPVRVTITTPCGTLLDQTLTGPARRSVGVVVPEGQTSLDATVRVSRTWQPAAASSGTPDSRRLGVGIAADSVASRELAESTHFPVELPPCAGGR